MECEIGLIRHVIGCCLSLPKAECLSPPAKQTKQNLFSELVLVHKKAREQKRERRNSIKGIDLFKCEWLHRSNRGPFRFWQDFRRLWECQFRMRPEPPSSSSRRCKPRCVKPRISGITDKLGLISTLWYPSWRAQCFNPSWTSRIASVNWRDR